METKTKTKGFMSMRVVIANDFEKLCPALVTLLNDVVKAIQRLKEGADTLGPKSVMLKSLRLLKKIISSKASKLADKPKLATKYAVFLKRVISTVKFGLERLADGSELEAYPTLASIAIHFLNIVLGSSLLSRDPPKFIASGLSSFFKCIFSQNFEIVLDVIICSKTFADAVEKPENAEKNVGFTLLQEICGDEYIYCRQTSVASNAKYFTILAALREAYQSKEQFREFYNNLDLDETVADQSTFEDKFQMNFGKRSFSSRELVEKINTTMVANVIRQSGRGRQRKSLTEVTETETASTSTTRPRPLFYIDRDGSQVPTNFPDIEIQDVDVVKDDKVQDNNEVKDDKVQDNNEVKDDKVQDVDEVKDDKVQDNNEVKDDKFQDNNEVKDDKVQDNNEVKDDKFQDNNEVKDDKVQDNNEAQNDTAYGYSQILPDSSDDENEMVAVKSQDASRAKVGPKKIAKSESSFSAPAVLDLSEDEDEDDDVDLKIVHEDLKPRKKRNRIESSESESSIDEASESELSQEDYDSRDEAEAESGEDETPFLDSDDELEKELDQEVEQLLASPPVSTTNSLRVSRHSPDSAFNLAPAPARQPTVIESENTEVVKLSPGPDSTSQEIKPSKKGRGRPKKIKKTKKESLSQPESQSIDEPTPTPTPTPTPVVKRKRTQSNSSSASELESPKVAVKRSYSSRSNANKGHKLSPVAEEVPLKRGKRGGKPKVPYTPTSPEKEKRTNKAARAPANKKAKVEDVGVGVAPKKRGRPAKVVTDVAPKIVEVATTKKRGRPKKQAHLSEVKGKKPQKTEDVPEKKIATPKATKRALRKKAA